MRHIFHTCLMAFRLIASVNDKEAEGNRINIFEADWMNAALVCFYVDPGTQGNQKEKVEKAYHLIPVTSQVA
jgi:hypothetical protein